MTTQYIESIARMLNEHGIRHAFGVSGGGESLDLITACEDHNVLYYPVAHEAAAALMAGACCRSGKTEAAAISIKGPGFANFVPGILSNFYEGRPALTISESYGDAMPKYLQHKRLDHRAVCGTIVKAYARANGQARVVQSLLASGVSEIPGPVHFDLCRGDGPAVFIDSASCVANSIEALKLRCFYERIRSSRRPAIILGSVAARRMPEFRWEKLYIPIVTTAAAKGAINEYSPFSGGVMTGEIKEFSPESNLLSKADLIVAVGLRNREVIRPMEFEAELIGIDVVDGEFHEGFNYKNLLVVDKEFESVVYELCHLLAEKSWGADILEQKRKHLEEYLFEEQWLPQHIFRSIQDRLGNKAILILDTGLFCVLGETVWHAAQPGDFCGSSVGRFMGVSVPTAIGVALSSPGKFVVCAAGDGGMRPYLPEIRLAVDQNLPILFLLISDGRYGTIAQSAISKESAKRAYEFTPCDWWRVVKSMGCQAAQVSSLAELETILTAWQETKTPYFLQMNFDADKYLRSTLKLR